MKNDFKHAFAGKKILVTGHTGFKGSWLTLWLKELEADVLGYSLPPPQAPNHFKLSGVAEHITNIYGDIRDYPKLKNAIDSFQPEIVFHLAAQPIVLESLNTPKDTFDINSGGTINILEASRHCPSIKAMIMVTSDKCYENKEFIWGYRESDSLGGNDPYSASKGMAEMAIAAYRASFASSSKDFPNIASVRAGNVIGGGDFSNFRIVPDCMRALMAEEPILIRNPHSTRPWLHVLDALSGYLSLAVHLIEDRSYASAWNFGPIEHKAVSAQTLVEKAIEFWGEGSWIDASTPEIKQEMNLLRLNWDKAANYLEWSPTYQWSEALRQTVAWFKHYDVYCKAGRTNDMRDISLQCLQEYIKAAQPLSELNALYVE